MHSEDHFSEEGLFGSRFSKSSLKFKRKWKVRVPSHASVSKYDADKTYADLWFILLQVPKGFRFQKNKRCTFHFWQLFIWQMFVKSENDTTWSIYFNQQARTVSAFRIYHIESHVTNICWKNNKFLTWVQDQNLLFTFLTNDYEAKFKQIAFSESVRISGAGKKLLSWHWRLNGKK